MSPRKTLEESHFSFEEWDGDEVKQGYSRCVLQAEIGPFKVGKRFPHILLDLDRAVIVLTDYDDEVYIFEVALSIGHPIKESQL
jgi:hypothetical protein